MGRETVPTWSLVEPVVQARERRAEQETGRHGQRDPEREEAVEPRELPHYSRRRGASAGPLPVGVGLQSSSPHRSSLSAAASRGARPRAHAGRRAARGRPSSRCVASISPRIKPASFSTLRCCETAACASGLLHDLAAVAGIAGEEQAHDLRPRGMPERLRKRGEPLLCAFGRSHRRRRDAHRPAPAGTRGVSVPAHDTSELMGRAAAFRSCGQPKRCCPGDGAAPPPGGRGRGRHRSVGSWRRRRRPRS